MSERNSVKRSQRVLAAALSAALVAPPALADEQSVELRSSGDYVSQRLPDGTREVELERQLAGSCRFNRSWGYDLSNMELWVNGGCAGRFKLNGEFSGDDKDRGSSNAGIAIAAVAAIAGLALLASRDKNKNTPEHEGGDRNGRPLRTAGGLCLDIRGSAREGAPAIVFGCHNGANQRFDWGGDGELRVNGLCLDVTGASRDNGARVIAFRCNGQPNQRWQSRGNQIRSRLNGKCLDVPNGQTRPGQEVQVWDCHGGENQRWWW